MNRRITALTIAAVALLGLTACSGSTGADTDPSSSAKPSASASASAPDDAEGSETPEGSGDSESVAGACAVIGAQVTEAMNEFESIDASSDPQMVVDAMSAAATAIGSAVGQIDNAEVLAAAQGLQEAFTGMADVTKAVLIDGDASKVGEMQELAPAFQESFTAFQELCMPQ